MIKKIILNSVWHAIIVGSIFSYVNIQMPNNYTPPYKSMKAYTPNFQGVVDAIAELSVTVAGSETLPGRESTNQQLDSLNNTAESIDTQMAAITNAVNTNTSKVQLMTTAVQAVEIDVEEIKIDTDTLVALSGAIRDRLPTTLASPTDYLTTRLTNGTGYYSNTNALPVSIPGGISIGEVTVKNVPPRPGPGCSPRCAG